MLARAHASQKYSRRPFSTEQVQVTGSVSATRPQRAQAMLLLSSGVRASPPESLLSTLKTITARGSAAGATHRGGRSVRTGPRGDAQLVSFLGIQCMTAMASARRARMETRSARRCMRRAATRRTA